MKHQGTLPRRLYIGASLSVLSVFAFQSASAAQTTSSSNAGSALEEIVVTAQKRNERLQDVPLAVTAINSDTIARRGLVDVTEVTRIAPNVQLTKGIQNPGAIVPFIRGIGSIDNSPEADLPVAVSVDGVYLSSSYGAVIDSFDMAQVEILRGPQGTLQGRNAPGGAVNITTRRPGDTWSMRGLAEFGNYNETRLGFGVDGPVIKDKLGVKLTLTRHASDGYVKGQNLDGTPTGHDFGGTDTWGMSAGVQMVPSDRLKIWLSGDYTSDHSQPSPFRDMNDGKSYPRPQTNPETNTVACLVFQLCTPSAPYTTHQTFYSDTDASNWGVAANINFDTGPATLTSVTGYRNVLDKNRTDLDATPYPLLENPFTKFSSKALSQELRLTSNDGGAWSLNDHIRWIVGGYYMNYKLYRSQDLTALGTPVGANYGQTLDSYAVFGHIDIMPTGKRLTLSLGARESVDDKRLRNDTLCVAGIDPCEASDQFSKFMYDVTVSYKLTPDVMPYFRYARGSRPGGFNQTLQPYAMETVDSYEGGIKTSLFDKRAVFNATVFYYKYKDIQRSTDQFVVANGTGNFQRFTTNAGAEHAYGAEVELTATPVERLSVGVNVGYLNAKYDRWLDNTNVGGVAVQVDDSALPVFESPHWTINSNISYEIPVSDTGVLSTITPAANLYYISGRFVTTESIPVSFDPGHSLLSLSLRFAGPNDQYALTLFGDNMLDEHYLIGGGNLSGLSKDVVEGQPRTFGARLEVRF